MEKTVKNGKRRIAVVALIICVLFIVAALGGCSKEARPFENSNFEARKVSEIGMINAQINDGGSPYGDKIWRVCGDDQRVAEGAQAFEKFISESTFVTCNYYKMPFKTGGSRSALCIMNSSSGTLDYVKIEFIEDDGDEYIINVGSKYYKTSKSAVDEFRTAFFSLFDDNDLAVPSVYVN